MSDIVYRKATKEDAYGIEFVGAHSWKETYYDFMPKEYLDNRILNIESKIDRARKFLESTDSYYVAEIDGKIVGILHYTKFDNDKFENYGHLGAIYVLKAYQGLGIGKELFKIALDGIINLGYNDMYLECLKGNATLEFYKKYGGKVIDTIDYPISDFSVKADIVEFNDIKTILNSLKQSKKQK